MRLYRNVLGPLAGLLVASFSLLSAVAQLQQIDRGKLPDSAELRAAYEQAIAVEPYAQSWNAKWPYKVSKAQVADSLNKSLARLEQAHQADPENHELDLLTGLVAHLAYNVDVESAYQPALDLLTAATKQAPEDLRGPWFLGIHQCESLKVNEGMQKLLALEASGKALPAAFWDDYVTCASVAMMPAHTLQAIDRAVSAGEDEGRFRQLREIAESRYKTAGANQTVNSRMAWSTRPPAADEVSFYSSLCGIGLRSKADWSVQVPDVQHQTCTLMLQPPSGTVPHTGATILVMVRPAEAGKSPEDLVRAVMTKEGSVPMPGNDGACAIPDCVAMETKNGRMYADQGGAHLYAVAFRRPAPRYDGLIFEEPFEPKAPSQANGSGKMVAYRPEPVFRRLPGMVDYLILLDASENIFDKAKVQYDWVLKSLEVE